MEEKIVYFEEPGMGNTDITLSLAIQRAKDRGIKKMVLASTRGDTARQLAERLTGTGIKMIVVPHQYGFGPAGQRFPKALVDELEGQGHAVHFGTMLFHTDGFFSTNEPRLMANLLRTFCQGMKVCVEITLMATNAGLVAAGENVVVVTGTGRGADTAVVIIASTTTSFAEFHVTEIVCKPLQTRQGPPPGAPGSSAGMGQPAAPTRH